MATVDSTCDSSQIHINFGDTADSIVISYVSQTLSTISRVEYATTEDSVLDGSGDLLEATGDMQAYSELIWVGYYLVHPPMGKATASEDNNNNRPII
jgi:hypothetical protein